MSSSNRNVSSSLALDMASDALAKINQSLTSTQPPSRSTNTAAARAARLHRQEQAAGNRSVLNPVSMHTPRSLKFDHIGAGGGGAGGGGGSGSVKDNAPGTPGSSLKRALDGLNLGGGRGRRGVGAGTGAKQPSETDLKNPVLVTFGTLVVLRSAQIGKCLSVDPKSKANLSNPHSIATVDVDGSGVGADDEVFSIVNVHFRNDKGPVRFGDTIALCSQASPSANYT